MKTRHQEVMTRTKDFSNIIAFGHQENHLQEIMLKKHFSDISLFLGK